MCIVISLYANLLARVSNWQSNWRLETDDETQNILVIGVILVILVIWKIGQLIVCPCYDCNAYDPIA